jgi:opacity protein-like surface antigen
MNKIFKIILASFILLVASINVAKAKTSKINKVKSNVEKTIVAKVENTKYYFGLDASFQYIDSKSKNSDILDDGTKFSPQAEDFYETMALAPSIFAGVDFDGKFKLETYFIQTNENKINNNTGLATNINGELISSKTKNSFPINTNFAIKTQTIGFDFKPYQKLDENLFGFLIFGVNYSRIEIKQGASMNVNLPQFNFNNTFSAETKTSYNRILPSVGIGLEYFVMPNLTLRTQFKYSHLLQKSKNNNSDGAVVEFNGISNLNFGTAYYF